MTTPVGRLVVLSGPSCVGKSPLAKALAKFHPHLFARLAPLVLGNSRDPRPGERDGVDYHFRTRAQVESLRHDKRYAVVDVRGDLQALDLANLQELSARGDVFFEGNPTVGLTILRHPALADVPRLSAFLAPLSQEEISFLKSKGEPGSVKDLVTEVMRRKLLRRTRRQKGELSVKDLENIERRAGSAYSELQQAHHFGHVIPNHDGEDSENWDAFYYPLGDARKALHTFVALLERSAAANTEKWPADLLP
jgi:guanylate kinase